MKTAVNEQLLTVNEVVNILRLKHNKVYELIRNGEIRAFRIGRDNKKDKYNRHPWRIKESSLLDYINRGENK